MEEKTKEIISTLSKCCCICRPDEYQQLHNLLIRQLAEYVLSTNINELEGNDE